ncbi:hypothetical protein KOXY103107_17355 [Komagataeibacter xylinus]
MGVRTPHEAAVGIGQTDLPVGWWFIIRRFRRPTATPCFCVIHRLLFLVCRSRRLGLRLRICFQPGAGFVQLRFQCFPSGKLFWQGLRIRVRGVSLLRLLHQFRDIYCQLFAQRLDPVVAHRTVFRCVGIDFRAVNRYYTQTQQTRLARQKQDLRKCSFNGCPVRPAEGRNRIMIRMQVRRHEAHPDIAICRPLDPA